MRVTVDAVGIRMGGGASLLNQFLQWLPEVRPDWEWQAYVLPRDCREFDNPPTRNGLEITTVSVGDSYLGRLWWLYRELPRELKKTRADVLLAFANTASPRCPVPQVAYVHQALAFSAPFCRKVPTLKTVKLRLLRTVIVVGALRSSSVIVQTEDMRRRLESAAKRLAGCVRVIPGCVSSADFRDDDIRAEKRHLIDACGSPVLVYIAHPAEHKNHLNLIRAFSRIVALHPNATLLLTLEPDGHGSVIGQNSTRKVRDLVNELGLGDHVIRLGVLWPPEVRCILRRADLVVFPSLDESFGLPLAEAITEGCAIAASDLPYAHDVAGGAAAYFNPADPDAIAECITDLIDAPGRLRELKAEASVRSKRFRPRTVAEQIAATLETAAEGEIAYTSTSSKITRDSAIGR